MSFKDKVVIVTGGSSGIGAAAALQFAEQGASVVIVGRNKERLSSVAEECRALGAPHHVINADVTIVAEAKRIVDETVQKYGQIDVLVNNAGIIKQGRILDGETLQIYDDIMNTNLKSVVALTTLAAPHLCKTKGNIINISSIAGSRVRSADFTAYSVSKAALNMFTKGVAVELASHGVRVNSISPGPVKTGILAAAGIEENIEHWATNLPLKRVSDSREVADLILFLASEKAKAITGSNYITDNGSLLQSPVY